MQKGATNGEEKGKKWRRGMGLGCSVPRLLKIF
jgi:hypothetical protein